MALLTSRLRVGLLVTLALTSAGSAFAQALPREASEYQVKAAILYSLLKFVEWPAETFAAPTAPVTVCVIGADPFGPVIDDAVRGRQMASHPIVIRRLTDVAPGCQVLFIATSEARRLPVILDRLSATTVLTVSEIEGFAERGGMIELRNERDHVTFRISVETAERARLRLSARLLSLAAPGRPPRGGLR
jgi:hypothetical protein